MDLNRLLLGFSIVLLTSTTVVPQQTAETNEERQARAAEERSPRTAREEVEKLSERMSTVKPLPTVPRGTSEFLSFRSATRAFPKVVSDYRNSVDLGRPLDVRLSELETFADIFSAYFKVLKIKNPAADLSDLKNESRNDLLRALSASVDRVAKDVDRIAQTLDNTTVSLQSLEIMYGLQGELLRLKKLTSRLKAKPRPVTR